MDDLEKEKREIQYPPEMIEKLKELTQLVEKEEQEKIVSKVKWFGAMHPHIEIIKVEEDKWIVKPVGE